VDTYQRGNGTSNSIKDKEFIDQLSDNQLLEMKLLKKLHVVRFINKFPTCHEARSFLILNIDVF